MRKSLVEELLDLESQIKELDLDTVKAKTNLLKQIDVCKKRAKTRKPKERGQNQTSGLQKLLPISPEIANFAEWELNELHSRVEITKKICDYIKLHDLQNPENRRIIRLDDTLKKLLKVECSELSYPHLQKYIGIHLVSETKSGSVKN